MTIIFNIPIVHAGTCLSQQLLWTCSPSSETNTTYFPNIPIDNSSLASSISDSPYLSSFRLYTYRFQPVINESCNGKTFVEFCLEDTGNVGNITMTIFLAVIDEARSGNTSLTGTILDRIDINAVVNCNPKLSNDQVCCHSERIATSLRTEMNGIAVQFPNQRLLEYNDSQNQVETFVVTEANFIGRDNEEPIFQGTGGFMNLNLRFLRLVIDEIMEDEVMDLPTSKSKTVNAIIATVLSIAGVVTIVLLIVAVVILVSKWQKEKRKINLNQLTAQGAFNNANC